MTPETPTLVTRCEALVRAVTTAIDNLYADHARRTSVHLTETTARTVRETLEQAASALAAFATREQALREALTWTSGQLRAQATRVLAGDSPARGQLKVLAAFVIAEVEDLDAVLRPDAPAQVTAGTTADDVVRVVPPFQHPGYVIHKAKPTIHHGQDCGCEECAPSSSPTAAPQFIVERKTAEYLLSVLTERNRPDHACRQCVRDNMMDGCDGTFVCVRHRLETWLSDPATPQPKPEPLVSAAALRAIVEARIERFRQRAESAARLAVDHPVPSAGEAHRYANSILLECADELKADLDRLLHGETEP